MRDLYDLFKRGLINYEEFEEMSKKEKINKTNDNSKIYKEYTTQDINKDKHLKENNNKKLDINKILVDKLNQEYEMFLLQLMEKDKIEIIDSAYEITVKRELKDEIENMNLHRAEKEMLYMQDDVLNELYLDWINYDSSFGESLRDCLEDSVAILTKHIGERYNLSRNNKDR